MAGSVLPARATEPVDVVALARAAIVARVGQAFFDDYIGPPSAIAYPPDKNCSVGMWNCTEGARKGGYSVVTFHLRIPNAPFVDWDLDCMVDADGQVSRVAAPKCTSDPRECTFPYDAMAAESIAEAAGLEPGLRAWGVSFYWDRNLETFVWDVSNTLHEDESSDDGRTVRIDANDGHVLGIFHSGGITFHCSFGP
jgi:hypothetical protein